MNNNENYIENLIYDIIEKYTDDDGCIIADRYDEEQNYYCITDEIATTLNNKGIKYCISEESGIDIAGFSEGFYAVAWVENEELHQYTFICEYH